MVYHRHGELDSDGLICSEINQEENEGVDEDPDSEIPLNNVS